MNDKKTKQAEVLFFFNLWVDPAAGPAIEKYATEDGHIAEVVAQPGFLWGSYLDYGEEDERGWKRIATVYGVESRAALDRFLVSDEMKKYAEQRREYEPYMRIEMKSATVSFRIPATAL